MDEGFGTSGFSDALVILGAAGIVIPAFARLRISPIIGFILIGMLVGPHGLGAISAERPWLHYFTISNPHAIEPFAELGIVLLLFSIGLELSFRRLWNMRRLLFGVGAAELLISALLIAVGLYLTGQSTAASAGLGLALALSSTAIVLALVPIVFALGAMAPHAADVGVGPLLQTMVIGGIVAVAMLFAGRLVLPQL